MSQDFDRYQNAPRVDVYSWCPEPAADPKRKATQVHLHITADWGVQVMRFKSARVMDELIAALRAHREDVWGKP